MWESLYGFPRGRLSTRNFVMFFAAVIVASFGYLLASSTSVYAADATWDGNNIVYEGDTYTPGDVPQQLSTASPGIQGYQHTTNNPGSTKNVAFIYFASGATPKSAGEATYIMYTLNPPNRYSDPRDEKTITIDTETAPEATSEGVTSCAVDNVGWLVCGVGGFIADGVDQIYEVVASFLTVQPISGGNNSLYRLWDVMRNFANVMFVIGFLVVIYSYLVGGGFSGYEIRKIIPRVVLAAILINVSYWICALAVDASNIVGVSLQELLISIRETAVGTEENTNVSWGEVTTYILSGGTIGTLGFLAATSGSIVSFGFMLLGILIVIVFSLFVAFVILAARQAIIIMLVILAPLAFAAYILPNTEKYFERWRGIFVTMLLLFPIFSLLFGGAQLAGAAIIQNAPNLAIMLFGMAVQVVPLIITPLLIKFSGGLIGNIAGVVNNAEKGLVDRSRGWASKQQDYYKDRALANDNKRYNFARRGGQAMYRRSKNQEDRQKNFQQMAENRRMATGKYGDIDTQRRDAEGRHKQIEAHHDKHYQDLLERGGVRRETLRDTRMTENKAKTMSGAMEAEDERSFQTALNAAATPQYSALKNMQIQTTVDKGIADMNVKEVEASGKAVLQREIFGDKALKAMNVRTVRLEKEASTIENTLKQRAEDNWERTTTNVNDPQYDGNLRNLRLQETEATQSVEKSKKQWTELVENISAQGALAPTIVTPADKSIAGNLKQVTQEISFAERAIEEAKIEQNKNLMAAYKASQDAILDPTKPGDPTILQRAGGIGGAQAQTRIYAQATKAVVDAAVSEVKDNRYLLSQFTRSQLHNVVFKGKGLQGESVTVEMQQAAMYELLQKKGNNDDAQVIRDAVSSMGMVVDETTGEFYEPARDGEGRIQKDSNNRPVADRAKKITDGDEVGRRRDWQQFFIDAAKDSPHSMVTLSGSDRSEGEAGTLLSGVRDGFMRDALGGKFGPEKILKSDIDELKILYTDMANPNGEYNRLNDSQKARVNKAVVDSVLAIQKHPTYKGQIDDRNRGVMNQIVALADPSYSAGTDSNGQPLFYVDESDGYLIQPPATPTGDERTFSAPVRGQMTYREGADWEISRNW